MKLKGLILLVLLGLLGSTADTIYALRVAPGRFDHFTLQVPEQVTAGEKFIVKALAQDAYNNLIANFSETSRAFKVSAGASATVQPADLTPASFQGGVVIFTITARKAEKLMLYIHEVNAATPVMIKEIVIVPDKSSSPVSELVPGKAPAEKIQETPKKTGEHKKTAEVSPAVNKEKDKARLKKSRAEAKTPAPVKKPSKAQTAATAPVRLPAPVTAVKDTSGEKPRKADTLQKGKLFSVIDISLMEAGGKGLLVISGAPSSGAAAYKYRKTVEHRLNREWLKISLAPAVRKIAGEVKLKSELIGEILLEEDIKEKDTVNIYIEFKAKKPFYDISEQKNALAVMLSKTKF